MEKELKLYFAEVANRKLNHCHVVATSKKAAKAAVVEFYKNNGVTEKVIFGRVDEQAEPFIIAK